MSITVTHEGLVSTVSLNFPPMNLLTAQILDDVVAAHKEADAHDQTRVIVTRSGVANVFSNGLDPAYVLKLDEEGRVGVFKAVGRTIHSLVHMNKPHICHVNGPAMAGGAIIAITADFRCFDAEHGRLSFSEPKVGLPIPAALTGVISLYCDKPQLRDVVLLGKNMDAQAAASAGLADVVGDEATLEEAIGKYVSRVGRLSPAVMRETKAGMRSHLLPMTKSLMDGEGAFFDFVGADFLGEGLSALVESRFPNFVR